jgi:carboxypeptidase family protein
MSSRNLAVAVAVLAAGIGIVAWWARSSPKSGGSTAPSAPVSNSARMPRDLARDGSDASPAPRLSGRVTDRSGRPIAHAIALVGLPVDDPAARPIAVESDAAGGFAVSELAPGVVEIGAKAAGFGPWRGTVDVPSSGGTHVEIVLDRGVELRGTVVAADGRGEALANVEAFFRGAFQEFVVQTDDDGRYRIVDLAPGELSARATSASGIVARKNFDAAPGDVVEWSPMLALDPSISGVVVDERGTPAVGWSVRASRVGESYARGLTPDVAMAFTDDAGRFVLRHCRDVLHRLQVDPPAAEWGVPTTVVDSVQPGSREIVVVVPRANSPAASIVGRVVDPNGRPLPNAEAHVSRTAPSATHFVRHAEEDGCFDSGPIQVGTYVVVVSAPDYPPVRIPPREIADGETCDLGEIRLQTPGVLVVAIDDHLVSAPEPEPAMTAEATARLAALGYVEDDSGAHDADATRHVFPHATLVDADGETRELALRPGETRSGPLNPGAYSLVVSGAYFGAIERPLEIAAGEETRIEIVLESGVRCELRYAPNDDASAVTFRWSCRGAGGTPLEPQAPRAADDARPATILWTVRCDSGSAGVSRRVPWPLDGAHSEVLWLSPGTYTFEAVSDTKRASGFLRVDADAADERALEITLR